MLWAFVPSSATQSEAKFMATTSLKFAIFSYFFQDVRSVILLPNALEKNEFVLVMLTKEDFLKRF